MSVCGNLRLAGFRRLLSVDGESLTFRGAALLAIVNRPVAGGQDSQEAALSLLGGSSIELLRSAVQSTPRLGEIFTDNNGTTHRIIKVNGSADTWKLDCEPTDAD